MKKARRRSRNQRRRKQRSQIADAPIERFGARGIRSKQEALCAKVIVGLGNPGSTICAEPAQCRIYGSWKPLPGRSIPVHWSSDAVVARPAGLMECSANACRCVLGEAADLYESLRTGRCKCLALRSFGGSRRISCWCCLDDLNLPFGRIRIRERGSAGGHHGLESILRCFGDRRDRAACGWESAKSKMPDGQNRFCFVGFPAGECRRTLNDMIVQSRECREIHTS